MALFPKEHELAIGMRDDAPSRMRWTREQGTRKLLGLLIGLTLVWFVVGKIQDHFLLAKSWPVLQPETGGLTVLGVLNPKSSYDQNLFKILKENSASRVVLTEYGWNSIFDPRNGPLCSDSNATAIQHALGVDSMAGDEMLKPYLRAAVAYQMGDKMAYQHLSKTIPLTVPAESKTVPERHTTLGDLLDEFSGRGPVKDSSDLGSNEGGSNSGREVEHVITLSTDQLVSTMPIVLTGNLFDDAWLEEQPANLLTGTAYTVHLGLTPEGRSRFFQWSHNHVGESLVFVLKQSVPADGRMEDILDVNEWGVTNIKDKQAAQSIVDYVSSHNKH